MTDYSKYFDKARDKAAIDWFGDQDYMSGQSSQGFLDGANWIKPMLMEAIEALEICASPYSSEHKEQEAQQTLASIREKLGVEE